MLNRYLEVVAGDTLSFRIVLRAGAAFIDLAPMSFTGGVRVPGSTNNLANFNFSIVDGVIGVVRVTLTPDQTRLLTDTKRLYEWYVRIEQGDYVRTLGMGGLKVVRL